MKFTDEWPAESGLYWVKMYGEMYIGQISVCPGLKSFGEVFGLIDAIYPGDPGPSISFGDRLDPPHEGETRGVDIEAAWEAVLARRVVDPIVHAALTMQELYGWSRSDTAIVIADAALGALTGTREALLSAVANESPQAATDRFHRVAASSAGPSPSRPCG